MKQLALWLNSNKMYLKIAKAEIILLKPKNKQLALISYLNYVEHDCILLPMLGT